jgi:glutathione synthase/RimK-type ligase-like ATP-grasp enzyme
LSVGILYESIEWSNQHLCELLNSSGIDAELINLETEPICFERILKHRLMVNRLFPSAPFRGYNRAFNVAGNILKIVKDYQIPLINPFEAYAYDCSKMCAAKAMSQTEIPVPKFYAYFSAPEQLERNMLHYPCILKPDCGGRSLFTYIINNRKELEQALREIPNTPFVIQDYIKPVKKYTTRVEIVGENIMSVMKRYVGSKAISSYHAGSVFEEYPDCPDRIIEASFKALHTLRIEMGSLDIIESQRDATSNFSADNVEMFGFDPIQVMAEYIITQYEKLHHSIYLPNHPEASGGGIE